jgi:Fe-S oxidoreductase
LRYGRLEQLADKISQCVRCGRCKTNCCVFYPGGNLFYHPRNKNLALMGIIEALLYDAQRSRAIGLRPLRWLGELSDHCTLCHNCLSPCPVNIDTGEVSILEREVLAARRAKRTAMPTRIVLGYLASRRPLKNAMVRRTVLQWGGTAQRIGARMVRCFISRSQKRPKLLAPFYAPAPAIAAKSMGAILPRHDTHHAMVIASEDKVQGTVLYFPGCGSERLHTDIGLASIFLLLRSGIRVVLPPKYLCCGYPARANAKTDLSSRQELHNTILFNQIRSMLGHIDFDGCVVSCGTCREALKRVSISEIFDSPLVDVAEFVLARGLDVVLPGAAIYHQPCHDSLEGRGEALLHKMAADQVMVSPHCCSEAGTLSLSRPDISAAMFERKRVPLGRLTSATKAPARLITNCPACLNGLGRQGLAACHHMAVAMANAVAQDNWRASVSSHLANAELVRF